MDELKDKNQNKLWLIFGIIILILIVLLAGRFITQETATTSSPELTEPTNPFPPTSGINPVPPGFGGPSQVINPFTGKLIK